MQKNVLGPIKKLSSQLNHDLEKVEAILAEKRKLALRNNLNKLVVSRQIMSTEIQSQPLSQVKEIIKNSLTEQLGQGNQGEQTKLKLRERMSPQQFKRVSAELSPIDTIEVSEKDYMHAGTPTDDGLSDNSYTPASEYRNGKSCFFFNS